MLSLIIYTYIHIYATVLQADRHASNFRKFKKVSEKGEKVYATYRVIIIRDECVIFP